MTISPSDVSNMTDMTKNCSRGIEWEDDRVEEAETRRVDPANAKHFSGHPRRHNSGNLKIPPPIQSTSSL